MADNVKTFFRLLKTYGQIDVLWFLRDTKYCVMFVISDIITNLASVVGVYLLSLKFDGIGGMSQQEILFMLGYATLVDGLFMLFFINNNMGQISRIIGRGQLDHNLIQPVPIWMQLLAQGFAPLSGSGVLICGIGITAYATAQLELAVNPLWIGKLALGVVCSTVIMQSAIYLVSCTAFYAPSAAEEIAPVVSYLFGSLKGYPLGGMAAVWQGIFCTAIPVGMMAWYPSQVLLGKPAVGWKELGLLGLIVLVVVFLTTAAALFRRGMRHYKINGSPRYSGLGRQ